MSKRKSLNDAMEDHEYEDQTSPDTSDVNDYPDDDEYNDEPRQRRFSIKNILITSGFIIAMAVALVLIFNKPITNMMVGHLADKSTQDASAKTAEQAEKDTKAAKKSKDTTFDFAQVEDIDLAAVLKAQMDKDKPKSIGVISVPDVNMELSILYGVSNRNLAFGAGTMKKNMKFGKGNFALAGHNVRNEKSLFSPLTLAKKGMKIYITDYKKVYEYEIDKIHVVQPNQVDVIHNHKGKREITLVTCNDLGRKREIVHGTLKQIMPINEAPVGAFKIDKKNKK